MIWEAWSSWNDKELVVRDHCPTSIDGISVYEGRTDATTAGRMGAAYAAREAPVGHRVPTGALSRVLEVERLAQDPHTVLEHLDGAGGESQIRYLRRPVLVRAARFLRRRLPRRIGRHAERGVPVLDLARRDRLRPAHRDRGRVLARGQSTALVRARGSGISRSGDLDEDVAIAETRELADGGQGKPVVRERGRRVLEVDARRGRERRNDKHR